MDHSNDKKETTKQFDPLQIKFTALGHTKEKVEDHDIKDESEQYSFITKEQLKALSEIPNGAGVPTREEFIERRKQNYKYGARVEDRDLEQEKRETAEYKKREFEEYLRQQLPLTEEQMANIVKNGKLYDPAKTHYEYDTDVYCDNCKKITDKAYGLNKMDLCLNCVKSNNIQ